MINTPEGKEVYRIIAKNISEALLIPPERVIPSARLITDLNAESIDIADIRFRLEQELDLKIDHKGLIASIGATLSAEDFDDRFTVQSVCEHVMRKLSEKRGMA